MNLRDIALLYAGSGIAVFPVRGVIDGKCTCGRDPCGPGNRSAGKHPVTGDGFKSATTDRATVDEWWTKYPDANIGTACFDVLDVDAYKSGAKEAFAALRPLVPRDTPFTRTGGGGLQLFFAAGTLPEGPLGPGIDSRYARRSYVILPPSRHRSGGMYTWGTTLVKGRLAPAPGFPVSAAATGEGDDLRERVREGEIIEIGRNKATFRFACAVARWSDDEELIRAQVQLWVNRYCRDPQEVDTAKQVRGTMKLGKAESLIEVAERRPISMQRAVYPPIPLAKRVLRLGAAGLRGRE
jgi:hypothetical protein